MLEFKDLAGPRRRRSAARHAGRGESYSDVILRLGAESGV